MIRKTKPAHGGYPGIVFESGSVCPHCLASCALNVHQEIDHMHEFHQDVIDDRLRKAGLLDPYALSHV